ncbi:MAG TPA: DapH/DapD/GlmU-related protein [Geobacteraceae bacterium]|nr:DapH/DapD/GlmU-related protein [Geobacteraceae bacterium]
MDDPRTGPNEPVVIGDEVWLGANVTVLKGVTISENTIVAAGSLVTRSLPPNVIAAGSPARVLRQISDAAQEEQQGK